MSDGAGGDQGDQGEANGGGATVPSDPRTPGYHCGLAAKAGAALTGIGAVITTRTASLPAGGDLESSAAVRLSPDAATRPLSMRFGYGVFRPAGALDDAPSIFVELVGGAGLPRERVLHLLGAPGDGFHGYAALYAPAEGAWRFFFDGQQVLRLQQDAWKGQDSLVPAFFGTVSVLEAPVLGTPGANACRFEVCRVRSGGFFTAIDAKDYAQVADVGQVTLDAKATDAFSIAQPKPA